jgi:hypothetical protein
MMPELGMDTALFNDDIAEDRKIIVSMIALNSKMWNFVFGNLVTAVIGMSNISLSYP